MTGWNIRKAGHIWLLKDRDGIIYSMNQTENHKNELFYNQQSIPSGNPSNPGGGTNIKNLYLIDTWRLYTMQDTKTGRQIQFNSLQANDFNTKYYNGQQAV